MWPFLRATLIWMLMLAIPAQGFAASAMLLRGPGQQPTQSAAADAHHDAAAAPAAVIAGEPGHCTQIDNSSCGTCASCCTAIALPSAMPALETPGAVSVAICAPLLAALTFLTDGPKRPPRTALA